MGRRKRQKLIDWFESKEGDEKYFPIRVPNVTANNHEYRAKYISGDDTNFFSKNRLFYNEPTRECKICENDVYIRRVTSWQGSPVRMVETNCETGNVKIIGGNVEYYIECTPKYYDKV